MVINSRKNSCFRYLLLSIVLCSFIYLFDGCRSAKKIQTAISKKDTSGLVKTVDSTVDLKADSIRFIRQLYSKILGNRIDFTTFSAKVKVNYEGSDGKDYDFNAFIRIQKDRVIWVLINASLGIEAFRVMITPDSVKVLSRLEKTVQLRSASYLREVVHLPIDFNTLQDLLVGNPVYIDSSIAYYNKYGDNISFLSLGELFRNYVTVRDGNYTVLHSKLDATDRMRSLSCDITYGDYEKRDSFYFSTYRKISIAEKSKLDIELGFKQYGFNDPLSFPFSIPKNYKRK